MRLRPRPRSSSRPLSHSLPSVPAPAAACVDVPTVARAVGVTGPRAAGLTIDRRDRGGISSRVGAEGDLSCGELCGPEGDSCVYPTATSAIE